MNMRVIFPALAVLFLAFLSWLYYPITGAYFANDDWILIWHSWKIPPTEPWRYFSMHTIWFYRPLQTLQYGLTLHAAGMNHVWFSVQSLIMHLGVCLLFWKLIAGLFGTGVGTCSTILFSISCLSPDTLLWSGNFNTLHHALFTLGASYAFLQFLRTGIRKYYIAAILLAVLNCFSKESSVNLGAVLFTVWLTYTLKQHWDQPAADGNMKRLFPQIAWRKVIYLLLPFAAIAALFTAVHILFFKNIESHYVLSYNFSTPTGAVRNLLFNTNFSLFGILAYPSLLSYPTIFTFYAFWILRYGLIIPFLLILLALWRRNPAILFCVLFAMSLQIPTFALILSEENRYFYLAGGAGAVLVSSVLYPQLKVLAAGVNNSVVPTKGRRITGYIALLFLLIIFAANVISFQSLIGVSVMHAAFVKRAVEFVEKNGHTLPSSAFVVFDLDPNYAFKNNVGTSEMLALATGRDDLYGASSDLKLMEDNLRQFEDLPKFRLRVYDMNLHFEPIDDISFLKASESDISQANEIR